MELLFFDVGHISCIARKDKWLRNYIVNWVRNPDKKSIFDRKTRFIRWLPSVLLIVILKFFRYGGTILCVSGEIVSHAFYQKHGPEWHIFSVTVKENCRRQGCATAVIRQLLQKAYSNNLLKGVRLGNGKNLVIVEFCKRITANRFDLPFTCKQGKEEGEIIFDRKTPL
jgi:GNAT superfamily N-acetyltransferase